MAVHAPRTVRNQAVLGASEALDAWVSFWVHGLVAGVSRSPAN